MKHHIQKPCSKILREISITDWCFYLFFCIQTKVRRDFGWVSWISLLYPYIIVIYSYSFLWFFYLFCPLFLVFNNLWSYLWGYFLKISSRAKYSAKHWLSRMSLKEQYMFFLYFFVKFVENEYVWTWRVRTIKMNHDPEKRISESGFKYIRNWP